MASVFLSYDRDDTNRARPIALALEKAGHSVWWDLHVRGGAQFGKVIEEALKAAEAVVVLWSEHSIESAWVKDEATAGRDTGRLVPVTLDGTEPPLGFRQFQTIDLSGWKGRRKPAQLNALLADVAAMAGTSRASTSAEAQRPSRSLSRHKVEHDRSMLSRPLLGGIAILVVIAVAALAWKLIGQSADAPVVAVAAADPAPASREFTRDLFVKLGKLQSARPKSLDLISNEDRVKAADLTFQVAATKSKELASANVVLLYGKNRALLWSGDFQRPASAEPDLKQQLAYAVAKVLGCAADGINVPGKRLDQQTLKTYLRACAAPPGATEAELPSVLALLRTVVRNAPRFEQAWGGLLSVEAQLAFVSFLPGHDPKLRGALRRDIAEARKVNPDIAEAYIIEAEMLPDDKFVEQSRLLDLAVERNPDNTMALTTRAFFRTTTGRMRLAVEDAERAVGLDPLSPELRDNHVAALIAAGRFGEARARIEEAERLWPGATSVREARYRFELRYGDPKLALQMLRSGANSSPVDRLRESFLRARIERTPQNIQRAVDEARTRAQQVPEAHYNLAQTLAEFDRKEELIQLLLNWRDMEHVGYITDGIFRPKSRELLRDRRFVLAAKHLGLLDYWRRSGAWPDFCFDPDLPYDCEKEAARLNA